MQMSVTAQQHLRRHTWQSMLMLASLLMALMLGVFVSSAYADEVPASSTTGSSSAQLQPGWNQRGDEWYYANDKGEALSGWLQDAGKWYYLNAQGRMLKGLIDDGSGSRYVTNASGAMVSNSWAQEGKNWFYATSSGALATNGWLQLGSSWYYFDKHAHMYTGILQAADGKHYYFDASGAMQKGWASTPKGWVYADSQGVLAQAFVSIDGKWYCFDKDTCLLKVWRFTHADYVGKEFFSDGNGVLQTGWSLTGDGWVYADSNGYLLKGWQHVDGSWYYLNDSYIMRTGCIQDNTKTWYCLDSSGAMRTGWVQTDQGWVYANGSGALVSGLKNVDGSQYYFKTSGVPLMQTGIIEVNGKRYGAGASGAFVANSLVWSGSDAYGTNKDCEITTGWIQDSSGRYYYLDPQHGGLAVRGMQTVDGKRYYFDEKTCVLAANTIVRDGKSTWYANKQGELLVEIRQTGSGSYQAFDAAGKAYPTGFIAATGNRMYVDNNGSLHTGWLQTGSDWYYFDDHGMAVSGWKQLDGAWYYMDGAGKMQRGWIQDGSTYYHMGSSGAMDRGWYQEGSTWYYLMNNGAMATGWLEYNGSWYHFNASGAMATGWDKIDGSWYYFYSGGSMATGWVTIDGTQQYFTSSGAWLSDVSDMTVRAQAYSSPTNYLIMVDVDRKYVGVYYGSAGAWNLEKRFRCSVGDPNNKTPRGTFSIKSRGYSFSNSWCTCYYYLQFHGDYLFHSPPELFSGGTLSAMGTEGSHGCVRVEKSNAKWMYETIPTGTTVITY